MTKGKILVTGGTGYIGSHTVVELIEQGYEPIIIDNLSNSSIDVLDRIAAITDKKPLFKQVEMCNYDELNVFLSKNKDIKAVIHFAAALFVDDSVRRPLFYYANNLQSTINLFKGMVENQISNSVFSSSCTVYGNPDSLPVNEDSPLKPAMSPYGNTKKMCEEIMQDATKAYGINGISLRYFNPVGAHKSALIGEFQHGVPTHLIPYITETAIGKRATLNVFGNDYATRDGSCVRDYIHVVDLAKAHIKAVERLITSKSELGYEVFNLGSGNGQTVFEIIAAFEDATGVSIKYQVAARRSGDVEAVYADTKKANEILGWKAELDLKEMMRSAWAWEQKLNGQ